MKLLGKKATRRGRLPHGPPCDVLSVLAQPPKHSDEHSQKGRETTAGAYFPGGGSVVSACSGASSVVLGEAGLTRTARVTKAVSLMDGGHFTLHATSAIQAVQSATLVGNRMILEVE